MTVTELRKYLEEEEKKGRGNCNISVVSSINCEPVYLYDDKFTEDIFPYYSDADNTITITD